MAAPDIEALRREAAWAETAIHTDLDPHMEGRARAQAVARRQDAAGELLLLRGRIRQMEAQRKTDLAAIHSLAKRLGLDDETYRALLARETGQSSAADLDAPQRERVIAALGGGSGSGSGAGPAGWRPSPCPANVSAPQWKYIGDLAKKLQLNERSFARLVKHITGLDDWRWLDVPKARALIAGMRHIQASQPQRRQPSRGNPRRPR